MRVLYIPDKDERYGAAISMRNMVEALSRMGVEPIIVLHREGILSEYAKQHHFQHYTIDFPPFYIQESRNLMKRIIQRTCRLGYKTIYYIRLKKALAKAEKELDFDSIDLIHTNVNRNDFGAILAKRHHIPHVWHIREYQKKFRAKS